MPTSVTSFGAQAPSTTTLPTIVKWTPSNTGAAAFPILDIGTAGQVLTVNAGATDFSWVTPSNVALSPNIITTATGTLVAGQPNLIEFTGLCTATLPVTCAVGQIIQVVGTGASTFKIAQGATQKIFAPGGQFTTVGTGGYVELNTAASAITLICTEANNFFVVTSNTNVLTVS